MTLGWAILQERIIELELEKLSVDVQLAEATAQLEAATELHGEDAAALRGKEGQLAQARAELEAAVAQRDGAVAELARLTQEVRAGWQSVWRSCTMSATVGGRMLHNLFWRLVMQDRCVQVFPTASLTWGTSPRTQQNRILA